MDHLPIFLDVKAKKIIIDGGGTPAARRAERALTAGANVFVFCPNLSPEFDKLLSHPSLTYFPRAPEQADFDGCIVAYGATENDARDEALHRMAKQAGVLVNIADVTKYCDFITPSVVDRSPLIVAVSSGGNAPIIARILRARIEVMLPAAYGRLTKFVGGFRDAVMDKLTSTDQRRHFWENTIEGQVGDFFLAGDAEAAGKRLLEDLNIAATAADTPQMGEVYLVGAGPGDPDLLTFKALRLMQRADVVLYDRLVSDEIMTLVRRDAERVNVGKMPQQHTMVQEDITQLMVSLAKQGKRVLRLKGGDPFIFGRGGEELEELAKHDIPFQVIPGITAASGCASYAGIPLTHRDHAQSCVLITAHGKDGVLDLDWPTLINPSQTVVVYMGLSSLGTLSEQFVKHGLNPATPAAVIDNGTRSNQQVVTGTIGDIHDKVLDSGIKGPALIIIGSVVSLRDDLKWFTESDKAHHQMTLHAQDTL
ncbi:MAG: uroporphyrinogen-III C-methyltransferase [Rhodobacteraceae bacterium]|nr:uroporphyrinogen-III C-methyltransferase [Paracoccaceae bacterium]